MIVLQHGISPTGCGLMQVGDDLETIRPTTPCCGGLFSVAPVGVYFCVRCGNACPKADRSFVRGRSLERRCIAHLSVWLGYDEREIEVNIDWH